MEEKQTMGMEAMTIEMEDGSTAVCEVLGILPANGRDYIILMPDVIDGEENVDGEYYIFRYELEEDGAVNLGDIEEEQEFLAVDKLFADILAEIDNEDAE